MADDLVSNVASLWDRWTDGGISISRIASDVSYAFKPKRPAGGAGGEEGAEAGAAAAGPKTTGEEEEDIYKDDFEEGEPAYQFDFIPQAELQRICCPITGLPMRDPVLAADGQAYERWVRLSLISLSLSLHTHPLC